MYSDVTPRRNSANSLIKTVVCFEVIERKAEILRIEGICFDACELPVRLFHPFHDDVYILSHNH